MLPLRMYVQRRKPEYECKLPAIRQKKKAKRHVSTEACSGGGSIGVQYSEYVIQKYQDS